MLRLSLLIASLAASALYSGALMAGLPPSADRLITGSLGILLGLYTASHPAAFAIDLFYLSRSETRAGSETLTRWPNLALNGLALLLAWMTVTLGAIHLGGR